MIRAVLISGLSGFSLLAASFLTGGAHGDMRIHLQASVAERCAIAEIDAEAWERGLLRVAADCNAERYSLRLMSGAESLPLGEVSAAGAADISLRSGQVWVTQRRPGTLQIEMQVEDPFALTRDVLSVRIEAI